MLCKVYEVDRRILPETRFELVVTALMHRINKVLSAYPGSRVSLGRGHSVNLVAVDVDIWTA